MGHKFAPTASSSRKTGAINLNKRKMGANLWTPTFWRFSLKKTGAVILSPQNTCNQKNKRTYK